MTAKCKVFRIIFGEMDNIKVNLAEKKWQWITLIFLALIWGSSFILMKRGLESFSFQEVAAYRIFVSSLVLLPFALRNLKGLKGYFLPLIAVGIFGNCLPAFLFAKAQTFLPSAITGMLNALVPLFTLIIGVVFFKSRIRLLQFLGITIGLAGVIGLLMNNGIENFEENLGYGKYVVGATICYALSVNVIKKYLHELNSVVITAIAFVFVSPPVAIYLFSTEFVSKLNNEVAFINLGYISLLGIFGTALAVIIFNKLIKHTSAIFAASVTYMIPIVAMTWGLMDGENLGWTHLIWITTILSGVYLVNRNN